MPQPDERPCAFLVLSGLDFNAAARTAEALTRETGAVAFVSYWKDRPQGASELRLAASYDGVSTFATVGTLDTRNQRFNPCQPVHYLPGQFGDAIHDVIKTALETLPGLLQAGDFQRLPTQSLRNALTDRLGALARDTLAAA